MDLSSSGATAHALLSGTHSDTLAAGVSRGSLIYGNSTPAWAELTVGAANALLSSDGTDVSWFAATAAGLAILDDANAAAQRTTLGLAIGTDVQAWDTQLDSLAALAYAGNGTKYIRVNAGETGFELAAAGAVGGSGTLNYVPKWTPDGSTLGDSVITDDGTDVNVTPTGALNVVDSGAAEKIALYPNEAYFILASDAQLFWIDDPDAAVGSVDLILERSAASVLGIGDDNAVDVLRLGLNGEPADFTHASAAGQDAFFKGQGAFATSGGAGGGFVFEPGAGDGAGADGVFTVRAPGGVAGTDDVDIYHDGTDAQIVARSGTISIRGNDFRLRNVADTAYVDLVLRHCQTGTSGTGYLGYSGSDWLGLFSRNWLVNSGQTYSIGRPGQWDGDTGALLRFADSEPADYAHGSTSGASIYVKGQTAFAASGGNGGSWYFEPGQLDTTGADGFFSLVQPGGVYGTDELRLGHDGTDGYINAMSGAVSLQAAGTEKFAIDATGIGFYNTTPAAKPTITGTRSGNAALADLLTDLATLGLITDSTTAGSAGGGATRVLKTADESLTTSTSLQDDDDLTTAVSATTKYVFKFHVRFTTAAAAPDIKVSLNGPAAPTTFWAEIIYNSSGGGNRTTGGGLITAYDALGGSGAPNYGSACDSFITITGYIETSGTAGNLVLRWAQRSSSASATTVKEGSWLEISEVT